MTTLKRELEYNDIVLATLGYVIGAGIFSVISVATKYGKDLTWLAVFLCGILALCTGFSFSELSSIFNKNAGEYFFVKEAFNENLARVMGFFVLALEVIAVTTVTFGLSNYLSTILKANKIAISAVLLSIFSYINYIGIRTSVNFNNVSTIIEVFGIIAIAITGFFTFTKKDTLGFSKSVEPLLKLDTQTMKNLLLSAAIIFFSFTGFDFVIELAEETKNPEKNIPYGMLTGIVLSTILYFFLTISAVKSIGWKALSTSITPMADVAKKLMGNHGGIIFLIIAMVSMSNTILMGHVGSSRFLQKIAKECKLPFNLDKIDEKTRTPKNAIIAITIISFLSLILGNLENSVKVTNIITLLTFFIINICAIILREKIPDEKRKFKMPLNINNVPIPAIIGATSSLLLLVVLFNDTIQPKAH